MNDGSLPVALDLLRVAHTDPVRSHQIHLYIILSLHNRWFPRFAYQWPGWPGNWWPDWWEPTEMPPRRWMLFSSCCGAYCWWTEKKGRVWSSIRLSSTGVAATKRGHYWNTCGRRWSTGRCAAICRRGTVSLPVCPNWCASVNASSRPPSSLGLPRFRGTISFSQRPLLPARTKPSNWPTLSSYKTRSPRWNLAVGFSCIAWHGNIPNTPWLFFFSFITTQDGSNWKRSCRPWVQRANCKNSGYEEAASRTWKEIVDVSHNLFFSYTLLIILASCACWLVKEESVPNTVERTPQL